jgi:hypothetical protein
MPEPDFAGLRIVAEGAVRQPEFETIERRAAGRRSRYQLAAAAAVAAAVALVAGATALAVNRTADPVPRLIDPGSATGSVTARPPGPAQLPHVLSVNGDGDHLYATVASCRTRDCPAELYASDDGGRNWEKRTLSGSDPFSSGLWVVGPRALVGIVTDRRTYVSVDGAASWRELRASTKPIAAVPSGQRLLECMSFKLGQPCVIQTLNSDAQAAPLASQPPIDVLRIDNRPADAGLWVQGIDRQTRKPALAVSHDQARTWTVKVFTEVDPVTTDGDPIGFIGAAFLPDVNTADGQIAYVMLFKQDDSDEPLIYRTGDGGGTWRLIQQGKRVQPFSFVTRDGAHVFLEMSEVGNVVTVASRDGGPYQPAKITGIPGRGGLADIPVALGGGHGFLTKAHDDPDAFYLSADGWSYYKVDVP